MGMALPCPWPYCSIVGEGRSSLLFLGDDPGALS